MVTLTCGMTPSARVGCEHGANGIDSGIEPPSNLAIGAFQRPVARRSGIEFLGKARAVGAERVQLVVQRLFAAVGFVPPFDGGSQRIERKGETFAGRIDGACFGHSRRPFGSADYIADSSAVCRKNLLRAQAVSM